MASPAKIEIATLPLPFNQEIRIPVTEPVDDSLDAEPSVSVEAHSIDDPPSEPIDPPAADEQSSELIDQPVSDAFALDEPADAHLYEAPSQRPTAGLSMSVPAEIPLGEVILIGIENKAVRANQEGQRISQEGKRISHTALTQAQAWWALAATEHRERWITLFAAEGKSAYTWEQLGLTEIGRQVAALNQEDMAAFNVWLTSYKLRCTTSGISAIQPEPPDGNGWWILLSLFVVGLFICAIAYAASKQ